MEAMGKEIGAHEIDKHWSLVIRKKLNRKNTIMSICYFKINRAQDGRLIKHKSHLCAYGGIQKWEEIFWETYFTVVNWMSVRCILTLNILRELHTKSVDFFLSCTQADVKTEICMEIPIGSVV